MANTVKKIRFKLLGERKPINFQIPISNMMLPRKNSLKKVEYIPGHDSIFAEDHEGDEKPEQIWMKDGILDVHPMNNALLTIMKRHPWNGRIFEIDDPDQKAEQDLQRYELVERALSKVNIAADDEAKAVALTIIGSGMLSQTNSVIRASLKKKAMDDPKELLDKMKSPDYRTQFVANLAIMRGAVVVNDTNTKVTWPNGNVIVTVPTGINPAERLGEFLGQNTEEAMVTLQEIDEKIKRSYVKNEPVTAEEEVKSIIEEKSVNLDAVDEPEIDIEEARSLYKFNLKKDVPANKKNDLDWILSKIDESKLSSI